MEWTGRGFSWPDNPSVSGDGLAPAQDVADLLQARLVPDGSGTLSLESAPGLASESFQLRVGREGVFLRASDPAGFRHGALALARMVREDARLPGVLIDDRPRFSYRGMHLDVSRHFFEPDVVKRFLDLMARYRMNRFHWHLTDDQGWRIEIKAYPLLTEIGSRRAETILEKNFNPFVGDGIPHGGFYTQEEVRDIVEYAGGLGIEVIPEIEMPGHARAALAAYPELGCTGGPYEVSTVWGVHEDVFCPHPETFRFIETVLGEVAGLFPSRFIHVGGDEVPKAQWASNPVAQEIMEQEGLADEVALQSWFMKRVQEIVAGLGRRMIGWDEIREGGLAPGAVVMSWRGTVGGIEAARQGHDVIMTPVSHTYFDLYQGDPGSEPIAADWPGHGLDLETVYSFEPVPEELTSAEAGRILGGQGNVWTEYISSPEKLEYMILPRMLAMSEVLWTPAQQRAWPDFERRVSSEVRMLQHEGYNVRPLD